MIGATLVDGLFASDGFVLEQSLACVQIMGEDMPEERQQALEEAAVMRYSQLLSSIADHLDIIMPILQNGACIWTGFGFLEPGMVVMGSTLDLKPYLFRLPQAVLPFRDLLVMLKVRRLLAEI